MRRLPPSQKEKVSSSARVTLRLHQVKEKKSKSSGAQDKSADSYNGVGMEGGKSTEGEPGSKDPSTGDHQESQQERGGAGESGGGKETGSSSATSPREQTEAESTAVKRSHSTEDDPPPDENRKKRRKEGAKSSSTSGGSPKSVVESEGEDAKSVGSPGPKVPPLKIVIAGASLEEQGGGRSGKNGSSRHHLPYVVSTSSGGEGDSASSPQNDDHEHSEHGKRVLRSHRSGGSGSSSPAASSTGNAGDSPSRCLSSPPPSAAASGAGGAGTGGAGGTAAAAGGGGQTAAAEPEEKPAEEPAPAPAPPPPPPPPSVELHPRKRKLRPKDNSSSQNSTSHSQNSASANAASNSTTDQSESSQNFDSVSNSFQLFLNIRKQIDRKRKGLFPVQPKPPQGFKDYLMNRCTYVLAGNAANRVPPANTTPPASVAAQMRELYISQEKERHRLLMQHVIEKEKLVLSVEQEILRVHGRAARALANQALPFSACTILKDEEVYSAITPEQEEKDRNARSRYNGRLFLSWLQDVDDKWEKIKESMLLRHHNEAESLHAVQKMDWEWKMKEVGLCDFKAKPSIDDNHIPIVHVSDDFDLLPA